MTTRGNTLGSQVCLECRRLEVAFEAASRALNHAADLKLNNFETEVERRQELVGSCQDARRNYLRALRALEKHRCRQGCVTTK
jgi:hypothetical protein